VAVRERGTVRVDGHEPLAVDELDAAAAELALREARERLRHLRQDPRRRVDQDPARLDVAQAAMAAQRPGRQLMQLGHGLDAGEPGAADHERQAARRVLGGRVGEVDLAQDVVAQADRVGQVLEGERVLGEPVDGRHPRDGAERDHEVRVGDGEAPGVGVDRDDAPLVVERDRRAEQQVGVGAHRAQRHGDVARLDAPAGRLRQQRRVEHEVRRVDDRRAAAAERARDVRAGVAASQDQRPAAGDPVCQFSIGRSGHVASFPPPRPQDIGAAP
jgi:hypothetical protein